MTALYAFQRIDALISKGEEVLRTYNQRGNIDLYDLWWTESKNFLAVNLPELVPTFTGIAQKYGDALIREPYGRASYNLTQEHLEVLKLAKAMLIDGSQSGDDAKLRDAVRSFFQDTAKECTDYDRNVFIMTRFQAGDKTIGRIDDLIRQTLRQRGLIGHRADDRCYTSDRNLWDNVRTYMRCCNLGIAVLEDIIVEEFNPNVALEYGFMCGLGKSTLLLKERRFRPRADILGTLWEEFDILRLDETIPIAVSRWLDDLGK